MDLFFFSLKEFFFYWSKQFDSAKIFLGKHRNGKKCFFFNQETANLGVYASIGLELTPWFFGKCEIYNLDFFKKNFYSYMFDTHQKKNTDISALIKKNSK